MGLLIPSLLLGGACIGFSFVDWVLLLISLSPFAGRCCITFSPFGWCFGWSCFLPFWCVGCCFAWPPSLGGAALFPLSFLRGAAFLLSSLLLSEAAWLPFFCLVVRCSLSFFVVLPSFPSSLGWGCFLPLFCWKVLPYLLFLWVVFWVGLLFPSLLLGGAAWPPSLGGVASGPLFFCVVLPSFSSFGWWGCFPSPLLLGGVAWPPSLGGVALFPLLLRGAAFLPHLLWAGLFQKEQSKNRKKKRS